MAKQKQTKYIHFVWFDPDQKPDEWGYQACTQNRLSYLVWNEERTKEVLKESINTYNINKVTCLGCKKSKPFIQALEKEQQPLFNLPNSYYAKNRRNNARRAKRLQRLYQSVLSGKSRKAAIRAFCLKCVCYIEKEVEECSDKECSLYKFRLHG